MDLKSTLKVLVNKTLQGEFNSVYQELKTRKIETLGALKLLVACCTCCNNNLTTNQLDEKDLVKFLLLLTTSIENISNVHYENYLQCCFHVIKFLLEKRNFQAIFAFKNILLPRFMPAVLNEKHTKIYESLCKFIYNTIVKISNTKEKKHNEALLKLSYHISLIYTKIQNDNLVPTANNCAIGLAALEVDAQLLSKFYLHILKVPQWCPSALLLPFLSFTIAQCFKSKLFTLATEIFNTSMEKLTATFGGTTLIDVLQIFHWLNPEGSPKITPAQSHTCLKVYYRQHGLNSTLLSVCSFVSSVTSAALPHYKADPSQWVKPPTDQSDFFKLLSDSAQLNAKAPYRCTCNVDCQLKTNLVDALKTMHLISSFGRLTIVHTNNWTQIFVQDVLRYIQKYLGVVFMVKNLHCHKWTDCWFDVGVHLYGIGMHLVKSQVELALIYLQDFAKAIVKLEGYDTKVIERTYLNAALSTISEAWIASNEHAKALALISFLIATSKETPPKNELNRWIRAKLAHRESSSVEKVQELTFVSALQHPVLGEFFEEAIQLDAPRRVELLVCELRNYKSKWKSKLPMMSVFSELGQAADCFKRAEVFLEIWGEGAVHVHDDFPKLLQEVVTTLSAAPLKSDMHQVMLASLYFHLHRLRVKEVMMNNTAEMERAINIGAAGEVPSTDPNETCEIFSSFDCLRVTRHLKMLKDLDKSFDLVAKMMEPKMLSFSHRDLTSLFELLVKLGHDFRLHGHTAHSLKSWMHALRIGRLLNNDLYILKAATYIIEQKPVKTTSMEKLIREADQLAISLYSANRNEAVLYYLAKAEAFLHVDFKVGYDALLMALEIWDCSENYMLKARLNLVHHKFIVLPCEHNVVGHQEFSLVKLHQAQKDAFQHYSEVTNESASDMVTFFDVTEELAKMYSDLRLPREVRCYSKEIVILAQKMILPLRSSSLLCYLAHADISSCLLDDCRVKVTGLGEILGLARHSGTPKKASPLVEVPQEVVDTIASSFGEMVLDFPASRSPKTSSTGSPALVSDTFKVPCFLSHVDACQCFYCTSGEFHEMVLKKTFLHATLNVHQNNTAIAREFFFGAFRIYEFLKSRHKAVDHLVEAYALGLLEFCNVHLRRENLEEALKINEKIFGLLEGDAPRWGHLWNEVLSQRLNILGRELLKARKSNTVMSPSQPPEEACTDKNRTPETKHSKVVLPAEVSPQGVFKTPRRVVKILKFDLEDEETPAEASAKPSANNLFNSSKTPAPSSKVKIYTSDRPTMKKKKQELPLEAAAATTIATPRLRPKKGEHKEAEKRLEDRGKLLTDKLSRKRIPSIVIDDGNAESVTKPVRLNLLDKLETAESGQGLRRLRSAKK